MQSIVALLMHFVLHFPLLLGKVDTIADSGVWIGMILFHPAVWHINDRELKEKAFTSTIKKG